MKRNRLTILVTLILIIIAVVLIFTQRSSTLGKRDSDFAVRDTALITKIFIVDKNNNSVLLERQGPSDWLLNGVHKAHTFQVNALIKTMSDLEIRSIVPKAAKSNVLSRLSANAKKVEIYQQGYKINLFNLIRLFPTEKRTKTYYVGGPTPDNLGTFMLMEGSDDPFVVFIPSFRGFVAASYSPIEGNWRDQTIFKTRFRDLKSLEMKSFEDENESFVVEFQGDDQIVFMPAFAEAAMPFDTIRMLDFLTAFSNIRYESLLNDKVDEAFKDSILSLTPALIITVVDKSGKTTSIKTYRKGRFDEDPENWPYDLNRLYGEINDGRDFVLIQYFVFDKVLRTASYFIPEE